MKLLFGTRNKNKVLEGKEIFSNILPNVELISLDDIDPLKTIEEPVEDGKTFYENSLLKAKYYFDKTHIPTICDDSGIVVDALNGMPGIYSARFSLGEDFGVNSIDKANNKKLLSLMKNEKNRSAHYECVIVYYDGISIYHGEGQMNGSILYEECGNGGFGYDPLFYIDEYNMSLGQIDKTLKNKISHRYKAMISIANILLQNDC